MSELDSEEWALVVVAVGAGLVCVQAPSIAATAPAYRTRTHADCASFFILIMSLTSMMWWRQFDTDARRRLLGKRECCVKFWRGGGALVFVAINLTYRIHQLAAVSRSV
jgi:hypothetical protein